MQQKQQPTALTPADPLRTRFCKWFNHPWNFIFAPLPPSGKKPQWQTETRFPLQPRNLWEQYRSPNTLVGLRFGAETRYLVIDLDKGSPYHPDTSSSGFGSVLAALEKIGLRRPLLLQSSSSGGRHLYYFLPQSSPTFLLAYAVKCALEDAGLTLRQGHLESFPNVKAYSKGKPSDYNAHRLPLQDGSLLLGKTLSARTNDLGKFLDLADIAAAGQDWTALSQAIAEAKERHKLKYIPGTSSKASEWKHHLEERIAEGWTAPGQTNELLKDFATYGIVWQALSGDDLVDYIEATAKTAPGYQQYCNHQHEIRAKAQGWARSCEGFYTPYCSYPDRSCRSYKENFSRQPQNKVVDFPLNRANADKSAQTQDRIKSAMKELEFTDALPSRSTLRAAAIIATVKTLTGVGMSLSTLHRQSYLPLWHPEHYGKQGVIACPEPVSADFLEVEPTPQKTLQPATGNLLHPPAPNEGIELLQAQDPSKGLVLASDFSEGGEAEGGNEPVAAVEPVAADLRRITALRLKARQHAQHLVRSQSFQLGRLIRGTERSHLEQIAKFRFYWESGELPLMAEATEWAISNPTALPEALPPFSAPSPKNAESLFTATSPSVVGDRVWWDDCPGHCSWMNPFTITAIDGDMAWLDFYSGLVPLSELRQDAAKVVARE